MNNLQSYTPVSRPLEYDSLANRIGTEPVTGNDYLDWRAYDTITVAVHDPNSLIFNQDDRISYCFGPTAPAVLTKPYITEWAAWVATLGVRIGSNIGIIILPADTLGGPDALYPGTKPAKLSIAFNSSGLLAMAIAKSATFTEISRYTDSAGTVAVMSFSGQSAVLFNTSLLDSTFKTKSGIVCLYLRSEEPNNIFGRFEADTVPFATEHLLMENLRARPLRLISAVGKEGMQLLYYRDTQGRDITLQSPVYVQEINLETATDYDTAFVSGVVFNATVIPTINTEKATLALAFESGAVYPAVTPLTLSASEKAAFDCGFDSGEVASS